MSTITTINGTDVISTSRATINTNFSNLNTDKIETSVIDTDTALAANSDAKLPSQKAVKAYVDTLGNVNASETARGIVEEATDAEVTAGTATGATGAKLFVTPAKLASSRYSPTKSITAGATINGATLPVPVYQNTSDNEFYACDGNDTAALKYQGFAISNGTNGAPMTLQHTGVVSGFTGLTEGPYYLSDTVGTIQTTPGTYEVLVGWAISETEILIQKGKRYASGTITATTAITTGFRPSRVRVHATGVATAGDALLFSDGGWTVAGGSDCVSGSMGDDTDMGGSALSTDLYRLIGPTATVYQTGSIGSITNTGFTITNSESTSSSLAIFWEAEGDF